MKQYVSIAILFAALIALCQCFMFDLEARTYKCFKEELPNNFDVYGEFEAYPGSLQVVDFRATDSQGRVIVDKKEITKGDFSFVTREGGEYSFCFFNRLTPGSSYSSGLRRRVSFEMLTGTETFDYESLARKEHLKPVEVNLRMMEDMVKSIHSEYVYFKNREGAMRTTNDSTDNRVFWLGIFSVIFMIGFTVWQVFYLQNYFIAKKVV